MTTGHVRSARSSGGLAARLRPLLVPVASLVVLGVAALVIHDLTREIRPSDIRRALSAISGAQIGVALALTTVSFGALALFDVLAVASAAPGVIGYRRAAFAGALGYAISNTLGFSALTGGALRYRIYAAEGVDASRIVSVIWRFRKLADREGQRPVYYAVSPAFLPTFLDMGLALLKIGEVARVELASFSLEGKRRQDFRYADRKAEKEGLAFAVIPRRDLAPLLPELRAVSDAWLAGKSGQEKSFSLGSFSDAYMAEFDCAVIRDADGIMAFANLWRGAGREEMSIDLMRYRPNRSKILMDALFARLLLYARAEGYRWFNLGAAPLSGLTDHRLASRWNKVGTLVSRHGDQFYHFEGLKAFKQKFDPVWTPQYIATPGSLSVPGILLDVTALISGGRLGILAK